MISNNFFYLNRKYLIVLAIIISCMMACTSKIELKWNEEEGYRWAKVSPGLLGSTGFDMLNSSRTNIKFSNDVSRENIKKNRNYLNGSGVAVGDINGNGLVDIYFASLEGSNKLYKNLGNYQFKDITEEAGVAHEGYNSTGVVFADVNGNGHLDLLITSLTEKNTLYINDGSGRFNLNNDSGLGESKGSKSIAIADINGNGLLDLYITNYKLKTIRDIYSLKDLSLENTGKVVNGEYRLSPPFDKHLVLYEAGGRQYRDEDGQEDELYINMGNGLFKKVKDEDHFFDMNGDGIPLPRDWGLTATFRDVTGNMLPDLYVANDFWTPDRFWINQGNGTFKPVESNAIRNISQAAMGVDFSDINRDGSLDFVVTEMLSSKHKRRMRQLSEYLEEYQGQTHHNRNSVYLNRGDNTFAQIAYFSGLEASEWSWATNFLDVDLDGYEDLIVTTGFLHDAQDMDTQIAMREKEGVQNIRGGDIEGYPVLNLSNKVFMNNGDLTFSDKSIEWGFEVEDISMGMALADLNNDGDMDLVINRYNNVAAIYENTTNAPRIAVRLKGNSPNTQAIGAKVELKDDNVVQYKEIIAGGNYLSGSHTQVTFAADPSRDNFNIYVSWPDGTQSLIENVKANRIYEIDQSGVHTKPVQVETEQENTSPIFEDVSHEIDHLHHESDYEDTRLQPLLPKTLSRQGPGVAWIDFNDNGRDDLFIASGRGESLTIYENLGDGQFHPVELEGLAQVATGDQTSIIGWRENDQTIIIIGSSNLEQDDIEFNSAYVYYIDGNGNVQEEYIPGVYSTTGPIAAADYNNDGFIDLFVGGRFKPGFYPEDASSRLFRNRNGSFDLDEANSCSLSDIGMVTSALFTDYNQNGQQDLLISTEWGTIKLFENMNGVFNDVTEEVGLDQYKGWWNGIATGDFTNNGLPDIVATNIGLNSPYRIKNGHPLKLYYDDINWNGRLDIIDAYYSEEIGEYVPRRKLHDFESIPTILRNVSSHSEYSRSSLEGIFNKDFTNVPFKMINTLEHMIFINKGNEFTAHPLPIKAQFTNGYYVGVADFDNDGNEDLFISQNSFEFPPLIPRLDAGRGLLLKGDGAGNFRPWSGSESGIMVYGEQRGAALGDYNRNGKTDIAISQNGGLTKLYMNSNKKSGIRVNLLGPKSNSYAIGSSIRVVYQDGSKGPRREIQAGSGYLSQNSTNKVLGFKSEVKAIEVTWFDGIKEKIELTEGKTEYQIAY